jgi:hypothetical protein
MRWGPATKADLFMMNDVTWCRILCRECWVRKANEYSSDRKPRPKEGKNEVGATSTWAAIGPLIFVPLYGDARYYIGPGFPLHNRIRYTSDELLKAGCRPQEHYLLARIGMTELNRGEL